MQYRILVVIRSALIYIRSKTNRGVDYKKDVDSHRVTPDCIMRDGLKKGVRYRQDVDSHRVTLDCIMRYGLKKGMRYKLEMRLLLREYGK